MSLPSILLFAFLFTHCNPKQEQPNSIKANTIVSEVEPVGRINRLRLQNIEIQKMQTYLNAHPEYNPELAFLIDFKTPSQQHRFFVVNMKNGSYLDSGLVAHGQGSQFSPDSLVFSNVPESYKSSLGRYKVGAKYKGNFGWSYKLHGLDASNSNAYKRLIVLHPYGCVPDSEPLDPICFSLGCPMVSYVFMDRLYSYIDGSKKPILLNVFY